MTYHLRSIDDLRTPLVSTAVSVNKLTRDPETAELLNEFFAGTVERFSNVWGGWRALRRLRKDSTKHGFIVADHQVGGNDSGGIGLALPGCDESQPRFSEYPPDVVGLATSIGRLGLKGYDYDMTNLSIWMAPGVDPDSQHKVSDRFVQMCLARGHATVRETFALISPDIVLPNSDVLVDPTGVLLQTGRFEQIENGVRNTKRSRAEGLVGLPEGTTVHLLVR